MKDFCYIYSKTKLQVAHVKNPCRYHKKSGERVVTLAPKGMCYDAFFAAYPYCLALLYNAKFERVVKVRCPHSKRYIIMEIESSSIWPQPLVRLKDRVVDFLQRIGKPTEFPDKRVKIKIVEEDCPVHKAGESFYFNIRDRSVLCPAGFYSIFPFIYNKDKIHCPDPRGIIYSK